MSQLSKVMEELVNRVHDEGPVGKQFDRRSPIKSLRTQFYKWRKSLPEGLLRDRAFAITPSTEGFKLTFRVKDASTAKAIKEMEPDASAAA